VVVHSVDDGGEPRLHDGAADLETSRQKPLTIIDVAPTTSTQDDPAPEDGLFDMGRVLEALGQVYDPEIPVSIVELGLVYRCDERPGPLDTRRIEIDMSMTAPGCGMGDILRGDAARAVLAVPGVDDVDVNLVWDPPWDISRMSEAARLQLGLL